MKIACLTVLLAALAVLLPQAALTARCFQEPPPEEATGEQVPAEEEPEPEEAPEEEAEPEESPFLAIVGGDVHTVTNGVVMGGTVLIEDDRIVRVGARIPVPDGARRIDAAGMQVYPGLIAVDSSGILPGGKQMRESFNPFSLTVDLALAGGLTTLGAGGAVGKATRGSLDGMLLREKAFVNLNWSTTSPSARRSLRASLRKVRDHLREQALFEAAKARGEKDQEAPSNEGLNKDHLALLEGRATARFNADSLKDLLAIADFLEEFPMQAVIFGGQEAWAAAAALGRTGARLVITPRNKSWADERLNRPSGWSIENARILHDAGVEFAILPGQRFISTGGIAGRDLLTLPLEAAFAIRGGLPQDAALEAITLDAAKVLGVEGRVGSLEPGKDADLIICDRDLFDYRSFVQWAVVNGEVVYDKQKRPYFAHIRPRPEPEPQDVVDAIRAAAPADEAPAEETETGEGGEPDRPEDGG